MKTDLNKNVPDKTIIKCLIRDNKCLIKEIKELEVKLNEKDKLINEFKAKVTQLQQAHANYKTNARKSASVAIDGYCARKTAERMIVRKSGLFKSIWVAPRYVSNIVPKSSVYCFSGFSLSPLGR